jgi:hypothetical protein
VLSPEHSRRALRTLFRRQPIVELPLLLRTLQTESPMSVFRRLSALGYLSSYNHNGRYYTLDDVPEFDINGLWHFQGVFFSKQGTLKATSAHLIEVSEAGHTHGELEGVLRVRVHNTLLDLVRNKRIGRELLRGLFVYVSANAARAVSQISCRQERGGVVEESVPVASRASVVEILLEIIHGAQVVSDPADVHARLMARGVPVTWSQVEGVFQDHGLKKTPSSLPRSSRR